MSDTLPAHTTDLDEVPSKIKSLIIVNDSGSTLHYYPNAKSAYTDHQGKDYTAYIFDKDGEKNKIHCGNIIFAGNPNAPESRTPEEIITEHDMKSANGEYRWGREL